MAENNIIDAEVKVNDVNQKPETAAGEKPDGKVKRFFKRIGGGVKAVAPTFAKLAVMGASAGVAAGTVVKAMGEHTETIVQHVDGVKDAIVEHGSTAVDAVKSTFENITN